MAEVQKVEATNPVKSVKGLIKVLSLRHGDVHLQDGTVLKYRGTVMVTKEVADWLLDSFKPLMQIV